MLLVERCLQRYPVSLMIVTSHWVGESTKDLSLAPIPLAACSSSLERSVRLGECVFSDKCDPRGKRFGPSGSSWYLFCISSRLYARAFCNCGQSSEIRYDQRSRMNHRIESTPTKMQDHCKCNPYPKPRSEYNESTCYQHAHDDNPLTPKQRFSYVPQSLDHEFNT